jgi:hypothetical protein
MGIVVKQSCTRCHRTIEHDVKTSAEADALAAQVDNREETWKKIQQFVESLPIGSLPAAFGFHVSPGEGGKLEITGQAQHVLCAPKTDNSKSRSCDKIAGGLLGELTTLEKPERKPKAPKAAGTEAAAPAEAAAAPAAAGPTTV